MLVAGGAAVVILGNNSIDGCFAYTSPARPLRSTDVVVLHDGRVGHVTTDHVSQDPSFNADGSAIVFSSGRDGVYDPELGFERLALFTANIGGKSVERLTNGPYDHQPNWSPVGSEVVFVRSQFGKSRDPRVDIPLWEELWTLDVNTEEERLLFRAAPKPASPYQLFSPAWSPDGRHIVFSRADRRHHDVWMMDSDGSNSRRIAVDVSSSYFDSPELDWAPDGEHLVFVGATDEGEGIHLLDLDTGRTRRIVERGSSPAWSEDGSQIAYWEGSAKESDTDYRLYVVDPNGDGKQLVDGAPVLAYLYGRLDWTTC